MGLHGPILVATDLSDAADAALREGHALAATLGAPLIACHVLPEAFKVRVLFPQDAGIDTPAQAELERAATAAVRGRLDAVLGAASPSVPVEIETGSAHAGILAVADRVGAGLVVVGPGATAHRVARGATGPVLVARPSPTGGGVLAATDFSDPSLPAVHLGADEARRRGVRFRVVHCLDFDESAYLGGASMPGMLIAAPLPQAMIDDLEQATRGRLTAALAAMNIVSEGVVRRGRPADVIAEAARSATTALVVVGTRGRTGLARLALGSVAEAVMSHAPCSVLVVPLHPA